MNRRSTDKPRDSWEDSAAYIDDDKWPRVVGWMIVVAVFLAVAAVALLAVGWPSSLLMLAVSALATWGVVRWVP